MKTVYFAHCMADYGNERERAALKQIAARLPDYTIINPNTPAINGAFQGSPTRNSDPMAFFRGLVRSCDALVFLINKDGLSVGAGVAVEVIEAFAWGKPVWVIESPTVKNPLFVRADELAFRVLSIEQTRALIARAA